MRQRVITSIAISCLVPAMIGANAQRSDGAQISAKLKSVTPSAAPERPQSQAALSLATVNLPVPATRTGSAESSRALARISGISIQDGIEGETIVDVSTTRPTTYRVLRLRNPERLVVDMEEARNATRQKGYPAHSLLLKGVRVGQFRDNPATVRVVADLLADPAFDVHAYDGGVRIELRARQLAANPESSATSSALSEGSLASPKPEEKRIQLASANVSLRTSARAEQEAASAPASSKTDSPPPPPQAETPTPVPTAPNAVEPQKTQPPAPASTDVNAPPPPPPPQTPESLRNGKVTKVLGGGTATQEKPKYTGEPISLNLKDVDLKDFFRLVHEISGLNIIVDPNVAGSVTMVLDAVPWDQALDIVLKNNRLDKLLEGNVLRIARIETLSSEQEASAKLLAARDEAQPLVTVFQPINYAKAAMIATILKSWVGGGALSRRGTVLVDERTNTLIISDIQSQIAVIQAIIGKLDKKTKQVVIEARIILATASFSRNLQAALAPGWFNGSTTTVAGGSTGSGASATPQIPVIGRTARLTLGQPTASGFGTFAISNESARYFLEAAIGAAETKSQAKTISRPTIITQNNVPGSVQQGAQIPIQTTINNTISIQYIAAALTLSVTPQVTEDGNIFLQINVTNASPGPALTAAGPSINTQSATTQVMVPDGGTVVFGGVTVTARTKSATYVPLLGSIPILGHLFKSSNVQDSDNELLFFVSPKVLAG